MVFLTLAHLDLGPWHWVAERDGDIISSLLECTKETGKPQESEKSESVSQLCPTLWDPMDCSPSASSVHGVLQAKILEWVFVVVIVFLYHKSKLWRPKGPRQDKSSVF